MEFIEHENSMKLNKKVRYGLRAIVEIAKSNEGTLQKDIAEKQQIPLRFLDSIITGLRNKGLIRNFKGKKSGYVLAKEPSLISMYDIYLAFESPICIVDCAFASYNCELEESCLGTCFLNNINKQIISSFSQYSLEDILNQNQ